MGAKKAEPWTGSWADSDGATPRLRAAKWHLIFDTLSGGEPMPPGRVIYTARPVDQHHRWADCEGFLSGRTLYWWQTSSPLPAELEAAAPGEAFLEVVVAAGGDEKAAAKLIGEPVKWQTGEFPWFGAGQARTAQAAT